MMKLKSLSLKLLFFIVFLFNACEPPAWTDYEREVIEYRYARDHFVKFDNASPLNEREKILFIELSYYDIDSNLRIQAKYQPFEEEDTIDMQYQNADAKPYVKKGKLSFTLDTLDVVLFAYQPLEADEEEPFFVPFKDYSCAFESYEQGRYMDIFLENNEPQEVIFDFNYCYSPNCAINPKFRCPIPPEVNYIPYHINVGEKQY